MDNLKQHGATRDAIPAGPIGPLHVLTPGGLVQIGALGGWSPAR